jgi:hypothetical protein
MMKGPITMSVRAVLTSIVGAMLIIAPAAPARPAASPQTRFLRRSATLNSGTRDRVLGT